MAGDNVSNLRSAVLSDELDDTASGATPEVTDSLHADSDLSVPQNFAQVADGKRVQIDVEATFGTEDQFLRTAPVELRQQLRLPTDATSEQVFRKMAKDMFRMFPEASPELQREALAGLGLQRSDFIGRLASESKVFDALVAREKRDLKLPAETSYLDLETAMHKNFYKQVKDGTVPIDYD
jgi:hypothetical protein